MMKRYLLLERIQGFYAGSHDSQVKIFDALFNQLWFLKRSGDKDPLLPYLLAELLLLFA